MQRQDTHRGRVRSAHAELCSRLALRLAGRVPPGRVAQLYAAALELDGEDGEWLRGLAMRAAEGTAAHRSRTHMLLRFRDWMRLHAAPWNDPRLANELEAEFARCRRAIDVVAGRYRQRWLQPAPQVVMDAEVVRAVDDATLRRFLTVSARPALSGHRQRKQLLAGHEQS
jgi:hypothetical protein